MEDAKVKLADDASDEEDEGGKSNVKMDGSSLFEFAEFIKDEVLKFLGERKVSGEGAFS